MKVSEFPHSEISGSKDVCSSPKLIAAYHVFHRLPVPRHSPCALLSLTVFQILHLPTGYFRLLKCSFQINLISVSQLLFSFQGASAAFAASAFDFVEASCLLRRVNRVILADCLYSACASYKRCKLYLPVSLFPNQRSRKWWAQMESNHRPRAYQARALTI